MSRPTTIDNKTKLARLTTRQELDVRTKLMRHINRILDRMACMAMGIDEIDCEVDENGVDIPGTGKEVKAMTSQELKAAEILLKKALPDLAAVQVTENKDDFANMSKEDMIDLLSSVVAEQPALLENPQIRAAVNASQTVVEFPVADQARQPNAKSS